MLLAANKADCIMFVTALRWSLIVLLVGVMLNVCVLELFTS
jgi:hypothetical protein